MVDEVKLLGAWASPFSHRIKIALDLKGIPYEYIEEDLSKKSTLLLESNPVHKKIPVLIHNGKPITESLVILEYIDETWKQNPILPEDPYERATARFWGNFMDEKLLLAARRAVWGEHTEKSVEETLECLKIVEDVLRENKVFGGEEIEFVDIVANGVAFWLGVFQELAGLELLTAEKFPVLFKKSLPPRDEMVAFFKARIQYLKGAAN